MVWMLLFDSQTSLIESILRVLTADLRERTAENSQNSSDSSDSLVNFCVGDVVVGGDDIRSIYGDGRPTGGFALSGSSHCLSGKGAKAHRPSVNRHNKRNMRRKRRSKCGKYCNCWCCCCSWESVFLSHLQRFGVCQRQTRTSRSVHYCTTGESETGYILEEHFVTVCEGRR